MSNFVQQAAQARNLLPTIETEAVRMKDVLGDAITKLIAVVQVGQIELQQLEAAVVQQTQQLEQAQAKAASELADLGRETDQARDRAVKAKAQAQEAEQKLNDARRELGAIRERARELLS